MRKKTEHKRNQFLEIGKELFFEKGYINVSVKEICDKLGTTTGSFYFLFPSKEKLLEELFIESLKKVWDKGEKIAESKKDLKSKITSFLSESLDYVMQEKELIQFYKSVLEENGVGAKTASDIRKIHTQKQEENLCKLFEIHEEDINHSPNRFYDLAKYIILILEHKQSEIVNKIMYEEKINKAKEVNFLRETIEGMMKL